MPIPSTNNIILVSGARHPEFCELFHCASCIICSIGYHDSESISLEMMLKLNETKFDGPSAADCLCVQ